MLKCSSCYNEQKTGKFCGKCGTLLEQKEHEEHRDQEQIKEEQSEESQSNVNEEREKKENETHTEQDYTRDEGETPPIKEQSEIKESIASFGEYFLALIKNPTKALTFNDRHFLYGLINLIIYVLTIGFTAYVALNTLFKLGGLYVGYMFNDSLPLFPIVSRVSISTAVIIFAIIFAIILVSVLASRKIDYKLFIAQYGGLVAPITLLNVFAMFTALSSSYGWTVLVLLMSLVFSLYIIPALIVFQYFSSTNRKTQKVYLSFGTIVMSLFITYIMGRIFIVNYLGGLLEQLESLLDYVM